MELLERGENLHKCKQNIGWSGGIFFMSFTSLAYVICISFHTIYAPLFRARVVLGKPAGLVIQRLWARAPLQPTCCEPGKITSPCLLCWPQQYLVHCVRGNNTTYNLSADKVCAGWPRSATPKWSKMIVMISWWQR